MNEMEIDMESPTGRAQFITHGGHAVCLHNDRWDEIKATMKRIEAKVNKLDGDHDDLHHRMFEGNGSPAIIPNLDRRVAVLESAVVPRDDVVEMVKAFSVGKRIIMTIATVAAVGFSAMVFWHFFKPVSGNH